MKGRPIFIFLLWLLVIGSASEAKAAGATRPAPHGRDMGLHSVANERHPADLTPVTGLTIVVGKVSVQRLLPCFLTTEDLGGTRFCYDDGIDIGADSLVFLRYTRLLLFPKHHFW